MAKTPLPGAVKTRLCPPLSGEQAARLAAAAIADTVRAARRSGARRVVLVLEGPGGDWLPDGCAVLTQRPGAFGERLAGAIDDVWAQAELPVLVIGMDTPQVTPGDLDAAAAGLTGPPDAVLGRAPDGGFWVIGTVVPHPEMFDGVPMSTGGTGAAQRAQLDRLGLDVHEVAALRDVDTFDDALGVALLAPDTRFAAELDVMLALADAPGGR